MFVFFKRIFLSFCFLFAILTSLLQAQNDYKSLSIVGQYGNFSSSAKKVYVGIIYQENPDFRVDSLGSLIDLEYFLYLEEQTLVFDNGRFSLLLSKEDINPASILVSGFLSTASNQRFKASWLSDIDFIYKEAGDSLKLNQNAWLYIVLIDADQVTKESITDAYSESNGRLPEGSENNVNVKYSAKLASVPYAFSSYVAETLLEVDASDIPDPLQLSNMRLTNFFNVNNFFLLDHLKTKIAVNTNISSYTYDLNGILNVEGLYQNGQNVLDAYFFTSEQGVTLNSNYSRIAIYPDTQNFVFVQEQPFNLHVDGSLLLTGNAEIFVNNDRVLDVLNSQWDINADENINMIYTPHNKVGILTEPIETLDVNGGIYLSSDYLFDDTNDSVVPGVLAYSEATGFNASLMDESDETQFFSLHRFFGQGQSNKLVYPNDENNLSFSNHLYVNDFGLGLNVTPLALLHLRYQSIDSQSVFLIGQSDNPSSFMNSNGTWFVDQPDDNVFDGLKLSVSTLNASKILMNNVPIRYYFLADYAEDFRLSTPSQDLIDENIFSGSDALFYNAYWDVDAPMDVSKNMYVHIANEIIPIENAADVMPGTVLFLGSMSDFNRFDFPKIRFFNDTLSNKRYFEWRALDKADYITNEDHQFYFELATVDSETNQEDILMRFINSYVGFNTITPSADFSLVGDGFLVQEPAVSVSQLPDYIETINNPYQMLFIPYSDDLMGQSPSEDKHYFVFLVGQNLLQNIPGDLMSMILMGKSHIGMADMVAAIGGEQHRVMAEHGIAVGGKNIVINGSGSIGLGRNIDVQGDHSFVWSVNESVAINETDHQFMVNTNSFIINPPNGASASSNVQLLMGPRPVYPTDFYNDAFLGALNFVSRNETNVNGGYYDQESLRNMSMFLWAYLVSENIINAAGSVVQPDYFTNNQDLAGRIATILETSNASDDFRNPLVLVDGGLSSDFPAFLQNADFWTTNIIQRWDYSDARPLFFDPNDPGNEDFSAQTLTQMLKKLYYHHYFEYKNQNLTDLLRFQHPAILKLGFAADDNYDVIEDNRSLFMIDDSYTLLANVDDNQYQYLENKFGENLPLVSMQVKSDQDAIAIITSNSTYNLQNPTYNFVISKQVPDFFESDQTTDQYRLFVSAKTAENSYVFGQELISLEIFNDLSTYIHGEVSANSLVGFEVESLGVKFWDEVELDNGISVIFPTFNQGLNLIPSRISIHTRDVKSMLSLGDINYRSSPITSNVRFSTADQNNHHLDFYFDRQSLHFKTTLSDTNFTSVLSLLTSNSVLIGNLTDENWVNQDENWVNQIVSNTQAGDFSLIVNGAAYFGPDYSFFVTQNLNATLQNSSQLYLSHLDVKEIKLVTFNPTFRTQIFSLAGQGWDYLADNNETIVRNGQNGNTLLALLGSDDSSNDTDELTFLRAQNFFNNTGVYVAGTVSVNQTLEAFSLTLSDQIGLTVNSIQINDNDGTPYTLSISEENGNYSLKLEGNGNERFIGVLSEHVSLLNNQITNPLSFLEDGDKTRIDAIFYEENFPERNPSDPLWVLNDSGNFEFQNIFENAQNTATLNIVGGLRVSSQNNLGDIYDIQLANSNLQQSHLIDITVGQYRESESPFIDVSTKIEPPEAPFAENDPVIPVTGLSVEFSSETNQLLDEAGNFYRNYDTFETSTDLYIVGIDIDMSGIAFNTDVTNVGLAPVMDVFSFVTTGHVLIAKSNQLQYKDIDHVFVNANESVLAVTGNVYVENNVNVDLLKSNKLLFLNPALTEDPRSFLTDETSLNNGHKQIDVRLFAENSVEGYDLAIEGNSKFLAQLIVSNNMDVDSLLFGESSQDSIFQVNTDVVNLYVDAASTLFLEKEESGRNLNHRLQAVDVFSGDNLNQNITLYDFTLRSTPQFPVGEFSDLTAINIDMLGFKLGNNDEASRSLVGVSVNIAEGDNHIAARFLGGDVLVNHDLETFVFSPDMSLNGDDVYVNGTIKSNQVIGTEIIKDYFVQNVTINNILDASLLSANQLITDQLLSVTVNFLDADVGFLNVANINFDSSQYVTINASNTLFNVYEIVTHNTGFPDLISPGSSDIVQAFQFNAHNNADQAVVFGKQDGEGIFAFSPSSELLVNNAVFNSLVASSNTQFRVLSSQQFLFQRLNSSFKFSDRGYLYAFLPEESTEVVPFFLGSDTQGNYIVNDVSSWQTIVLETQSEEHGDDSVGLVFNNDDLQQAAIIHTSSNFQFVLNNDTPLLISKNASVKIGYQTGDMLEDSLNVTDNMLVDTLLFAENGFGRFLKSGPVQVSSNVEFFNNVSNLIQNLDVDVSNQGTYVAHAMHLESDNLTTQQDVYLSKLKIITGNLLHGLDANVLGLSVDLQSNSILDFTGLSINVLESANAYAAVFNGAGVGIGNVSPNAALDISGNFYLSGNFSIKDEAENFLQSNRFDSLDISYMGVTVNRLDASWDNNNSRRPLSDLTLTGITLNISNHLASADNDLSLRVISSLNMQGVAGVSVNAVSTLASFNSTFVANAVPNLSADRLYVNQRLLFNNLTQESALVYVQEQISQNMWQLLTQNISQQRLFDIGHRPNIISTDADGNPGPIASQLNAQQKALYLLNRLNTKIPEYAGSHHENWEEAKVNFEYVINATYEVLDFLQQIHDGILDYDTTQARVVALNNHINDLLVGIATVSNNFIYEDLAGNTNTTYAFNQDGNNRAIKFYPSTFIPSYIKYSFLWYQFYILRDFEGRFRLSYSGDSVVSLDYPDGITKEKINNLVNTFFENYGSIKASFETLNIDSIIPIVQPHVYNNNNYFNLEHLNFMLGHQTTFFTEYMYTILNYFNNNNISYDDIIKNQYFDTNFATNIDIGPHYDVIYDRQGVGFFLYSNEYVSNQEVDVTIASEELNKLFDGSDFSSVSFENINNVDSNLTSHRMPDAYHTIIQGQDSLTKRIGVVNVELNPHRYNETEHIVYDFVDFAFLVENYTVNVYRSLKRIQDILQYHVAPTMIITGNMLLGGDQTASIVSVDQYILEDVTVTSYKNSTFDFTDAPSLHISVDDAYTSEAVKLPLFAVSEKLYLDNIDPLNMGVVNQNLYFVSTPNNQKHAFLLNHQSNPQAGLTMVDETLVDGVVEMGINYNANVLNEDISDDLSEMSVSINASFQVNSTLTQTLESEDFSVFNMRYHLTSNSLEEASNLSDVNTYAAIKVDLQEIVGARTDPSTDPSTPSPAFNIYGLYVDMSDVSRNETLTLFNYFSDTEFTSTDSVYAAIFKGDVAILSQNVAASFPLRGYNEGYSFQDYFNQGIDVTKNAHLTIYTQNQEHIFKVTSNQNTLLNVERFTNDSSRFYAMGLAHSQPTALLTVTPSFYMKAGNETQFLVSSNHDVILTTNLLELGELYVSNLRPTRDIDMQVKVKSVTINGSLFLTENRVQALSTDTYRDNGIMKKGIYANYLYDKPFSLVEPNTESVGFMDVSLKFDDVDHAVLLGAANIFATKVDMSSLILSDVNPTKMYSAIFSTTSTLGYESNDGLDFNQMAVLAKPRVLLTGRKHSKTELNDIINNKLISSNYVNNNLVIYQEDNGDNRVNGAVSFFLPKAIRLKSFNGVNRQINQSDFITQFASQGATQDNFVKANFDSYYQFHSSFYNKVGMYLPSSEFRGLGGILHNLLDDSLGLDQDTLSDFTNDLYDFYQLRIDFTNSFFYFDLDKYYFDSAGSTYDENINFPILSMSRQNNKPFLYFNHPNIDINASIDQEYHLFFPKYSQGKALALLGTSSFQFLPSSNVSSISSHYSLGFEEDTFTVNLAVNSENSNHAFQIGPSSADFYFKALYVNDTGSSNDKARINIYNNVDSTFENIDYGLLQVVNNADTYTAVFDNTTADASVVGMAVILQESQLSDMEGVEPDDFNPPNNGAFSESFFDFQIPDDQVDSSPYTTIGSFKPRLVVNTNEEEEQTRIFAGFFESRNADYAEFLPKVNPDENIQAADVVGLYQGSVTLDTRGADKLMVISNISIVVGNAQPDSLRHLYEQVAFLGQVPVKVHGSASYGQWLIPSGLSDGHAVAVDPSLMWMDQVVGQVINTKKETMPNQVWALVGFDISQDYFYQHIQMLRDEINKTKDQLNRLQQNYALFLSQQHELEQLLQDKGL